jgi:hypothetical protein
MQDVMVASCVKSQRGIACSANGGDTFLLDAKGRFSEMLEFINGVVPG